MESLLNFDQPLDVAMLDQAVAAFFTGTAPMEVQTFLVRFREHPQSWTRVDSILTQSQNMHTKILALGILENTVHTRWKILPPDQREGIKKFIVNIIIEASSDPKNLQTMGPFISKLNLVLVEIVKHEWPHNWPSFIPELVNSSRQSESLCANNINILKLLSEEIFDFSQDEMTSEKAQNLKKSLNSQFTLIFQLCDYVLENSQDGTLLSATLETLQRFLNWIPVGYIFETNLIERLAMKFFPQPAFQNQALVCLCQIGGLQVPEKPEYNVKFVQLFGAVISFTCQNLLTPQVDVAKAAQSGDPNVQAFIRYITIFITSFLRNHLSLVENGDDASRQVLLQGLLLLLRLSQVEDVEVFKIALEYWGRFVADLYNKQRQSQKSQFSQVQPLMLGQLPPESAATQRVKMYSQILSQLRVVMISRMAKPEEIIVVEDEYGHIIRERMRATDSVVIYKNMRSCLVYLTHLDTRDTQDIMLHKMSKQLDGSEWGWKQLNTLCWAIGSISGALTENAEKNFLVSVIKDLLTLCERKRGKDHKAVIASNIMYVVGQYPRFLRMHWKFLKTVVNKLFEFMHETHPGVQEMSCETFVKIAKKCRRKFVVTQVKEHRPFVEEILENLPDIIRDLERDQIHIFYEAVACIIQSETEPERVQMLTVRLMTMPNQAWSKIVTEANSSLDILWQPNTIKTLSWVLTINIKVAHALGPAFVVQLGRIYLEMLHVYKLYSGYISNEFQQKGDSIKGAAYIRYMKNVKKRVLNLIREYVKSCQQSDLPNVMNNFLPALLEPVLDDYGRSVTHGREPEVLGLFTEIIRKFKSAIVPHVGRIFSATFSCTLDMIKTNFSDYPEHRLEFFRMMRAINTHAFAALLALNGQQFQLVMDSIVWAFKHIERNVAEEGLYTLLELLQNVQTSEIANDFYKSYFLSLLQDLLGVLTDTFHKPGFSLHSTILARLFGIVENGNITAPLWDTNTQQFPNNQSFVRQFTVKLLTQAFPNVSGQQITNFVHGLFQLNSNLPQFKVHLRDFLVQTKEFASTEDNIELYNEERARQKAEQMAAQQAVVNSVPGLAYEPPRKGEESMDTKIE